MSNDDSLVSAQDHAWLPAGDDSSASAYWVMRGFRQEAAVGALLLPPATLAVAAFRGTAESWRAAGDGPRVRQSSTAGVRAQVATLPSTMWVGGGRHCATVDVAPPCHLVRARRPELFCLWCSVGPSVP